MSCRKGGTHDRKPVHQNTFAFRHNLKSKKTEKILASPVKGVCQRCIEQIVSAMLKGICHQLSICHHDFLSVRLSLSQPFILQEWKKKYRKYKPLTKPAKWYWMGRGTYFNFLANLIRNKGGHVAN